MDRVGFVTAVKEKLGTKKVQYIAIIIIILAIVAIYFSSFGSESVTQEETEAKVKQDLQQQLSEALSSVENAGKVKVVITYESSGELVPGYSSQTNTSTSEDGDKTNKTINEQSSPITVHENGGTSALIVQEIEPEVKGVLVIAQGAGNIKVKMDLLNAVTTLLNVSADKVEILKMSE